MQIGVDYTRHTRDFDFRPRYDYKQFYERIFKRTLQLRKFPFFKTYCPFHKDTKTPNLNVNIASGRLHCYACGKTASASEFIAKYSEDGSEILFDMPEVITDEKQIQRIKQFQKNTRIRELTELDLAVEQSLADQSHKFLLRVPSALTELQATKGLSLETITKYNIGFGQGVFSIPIPDQRGKIASLKFHKKYQTEGSYSQLYPWEAVLGKEKYVILVEGEFDMLILRQLGLNAVTQTAGANSWNADFTPYFAKKVVYIAYDNDQAGKKGAKELSNHFKQEKINSYTLNWPSYMLDKEDHVDYFVKYGKTIEHYKRLLGKATIN